jgi:hypothetical protein
LSDERRSGLLSRNLYDLMTGDEDARVCTDISEAACSEQPLSFLVHLGSLIATKLGDELASAKLTLAWVLTTLGAPPFFTGMLVPVRESLSLLPQLLVASAIRRAPVRKWFWVVGSVIQGTALAGVAAVVIRGVEGATGGWMVIGLLVVFSLARGVCSVAAKDVLGKTVAKTRRGTVSGYATAVAGIGAVGVGLYLQQAQGEGDTRVLVLLLVTAVGLWLLGAFIYSLLPEAPGATEGSGNAINEALSHLRLLRSDRQLRRFLTTRVLLLSTALAVPYYVVMARQGHSGAPGLGTLGALIVASGVASALSAPIWGRLSDRSARQVMALAAVVAASAGIGTVLAASLGLAVGQSPLLISVALFVLSIAHAGVRLGRKTYLVDMARADNRAAYVAVSNTVIGVCLLLLGAATGALGSWLGPQEVIALLSLVSLAAALMAWRLDEVE